MNKKILILIGVVMLFLAPGTSAFLLPKCSVNSHVPDFINENKLPTSPGDYIRFIISDWRIRSYRIHIPQAYNSNTPASLVLVLHGGGGRSQAMETKLDYDIPSQRPTKLLKELGLLDRKKGEKNRSFRNYSGRREYNIKIEDLRFVISKSEYDILKIRYNIEFTEPTEDKPIITEPVDPQDTRETEPRGTSPDELDYLFVDD